jgi:hypothetical protein
MKIRPIGVESDGRTDGQTVRNDEANCRFPQFCERASELCSSTPAVHQQDTTPTAVVTKSVGKIFSLSWRVIVRCCGVWHRSEWIATFQTKIVGTCPLGSSTMKREAVCSSEGLVPTGQLDHKEGSSMLFRRAGTHWAARPHRGKQYALQKGWYPRVRRHGVITCKTTTWSWYTCNSCT